ncbi:hypothetical protein M9H77_02459 [Catharanthus roseus]|uniref:Uncharacterized protein n=1 Tax=Catharanthus roseus TaxID=4058 RepID=A0ACC0C8G4_CATRO|nr:hypothetical protein M9H77_02459 [Catharanthus roseus]
MTQDEHEDVETFQGPVTRSIEKKIEEKTKGMITLFNKNFRDLIWNATEGENEDQRSTKTFLKSIIQIEKAKGTSLKELEDEKEGWNPTAGSRVHPTVHGRVMAREEKWNYAYRRQLDLVGQFVQNFKRSKIATVENMWIDLPICCVILPQNDQSLCLNSSSLSFNKPLNGVYLG